MRNYEIKTDTLGETTIKATEGNKQLWIPLDPANSDYAEYLRYEAWVAEGNNPEDFWTQTEII